MLSQRTSGKLLVAALLLAACSSQGEATPDAEADPVIELPAAPDNPDTLEAREIFAPEQVLEYRIQMPAVSAQELEEHGNREEYLPAALTVSGGYFETVEFQEVGLRHKGAWSLHHCWDDNDGERSYDNECARLSYKIKFHEYDETNRLFGLKRLNLHAARSDSSLVKEMLIYSTYNDFGVDAPRAAPAKLYINDELIGVFIAVEAIDGRYAAFRNPESGDGNLYKETWPKPDLDDSYFESALRTNDEEGDAFNGFPNGTPDVSDMQAFAEAIAATDAENFTEDMQDWVSIENLLRYMAIDRAVKNWDGVVSFYTPLTSHNFFWYRDNAPGSRFELIPWDMDNTFWEHDPYMNPEGAGLDTDAVPDWNVNPASCEPISVWEAGGDLKLTPPGCDKLLQLLASTHWEQFQAFGEELLNDVLSPETVTAKLDTWIALMRPAVIESRGQLGSWTSGTRRAREEIDIAIEDFGGYLLRVYEDETLTANAGGTEP